MSAILAFAQTEPAHRIAWLVLLTCGPIGIIISLYDNGLHR